MKKFILVTMIIFTFVTFANPNSVIKSGLQYSNNGKLIPPDKVYLRKALKAYKDGYNQSAYSFFKKAAAFGNTIAIKYIGMMNLKSLGVSRNWGTGYAWIKLASLDGTPVHINLEKKIYKLLKPEEITKSKIVFSKILEEYGVLAALKRRDSWYRRQKMKMTGSMVGAQTSNVYSYNSIGRLISADSSGRFDEVKSFVEDFNYGYVNTGEIIPIED